MERSPTFDSVPREIDDAPVFLTVPMNGHPTTALRSHAHGLTVNHSETSRKSFVSLTVERDDFGALYSPLSANDARTLAAALMRAADSLDNGAGKQ